MTKLYLITGFLGAGKTTFLSQFSGLFPDRKIALVINEFGAVGVDGTLLRKLDATLTEINNGSIFCACRIEQFESAIQRIMEENRPDLIFVEASGLADPAEVRRIFRPGAFPALEYAGAICLTDAVRFHKVYQTARVCRMQLAISDLVLINKTDAAAREQIDAITSVARAQKPARPVHETTYGRFDLAWLSEMEQAQTPGDPSALPEGHLQDINLQKLTLSVSGFTRQSLESFLRMFAEDTYRIKGFVDSEETMWFVDCVGPLVEIHPFSGNPSEAGQLTVLFGHGLPAKKRIREAIACFPECNVNLKRFP